MLVNEDIHMFYNVAGSNEPPGVGHFCGRFLPLHAVFRCSLPMYDESLVRCGFACNLRYLGQLALCAGDCWICPLLDLLDPSFLRSVWLMGLSLPALRVAD